MSNTKLLLSALPIRNINFPSQAHGTTNLRHDDDHTTLLHPANTSLYDPRRYDHDVPPELTSRLQHRAHTLPTCGLQARPQAVAGGAAQASPCRQRDAGRLAQVATNMLADRSRKTTAWQSAGSNKCFE